IHAPALAAAVIPPVAVFLWYRGYMKGSMSLSRDERLRKRFLKAMGRRGFEKRPNEGLEEFAEGVTHTLGIGDPVARAATDFAVSFGAFYFNDTAISPPEFKRLEGVVRDIRLRRRT
ncbi:MAG: hypothetical protein FWE55_01565, partial [Synergistaceae bacterium]|nr:hypothetical protein [Synergistaceae bacterium]